MPPARVYLYQEQVEALIARGPGAEGGALGLSLDDDDVFHVYTELPQTHFAGLPARVRVSVLPGPPDLSGRQAVQHRWGEGEPARIGVALWRGPAGADGLASVLSGPRAGEASLHIVPIRTDLASRAKGLLETEALAGRSVAIAGLGSGGSMIALALSQAGLGRIVLIDRDRLEVSNVARHACGINDLGRLKTRAMRDLLRGKNPFMRVDTHDLDVTRDIEALERAVEGVDLLVAATDSDPSRFVLNRLALKLGTTALFGRALTRAAGGDVLRVRPRRGPCLACIFTAQYLASRPREISRLSEAQEALSAYVPADQQEAAIQVGLASDIAPITNMIVKLALVELSRGRGGGLDALDADLGADFYTWANRREGAYAGYAPLGTFVDGLSILRWYGVSAERRPDCPECAARASEADADSVFFGP